MFFLLSFISVPAHVLSPYAFTPCTLLIYIHKIFPLTNSHLLSFTPKDERLKACQRCQT